MSLWSLPLESLTFEQLDDFLSMKLREGSRLDYKLEVPRDLDKIIAAFANTLGGLIVLGVDEDTTTTEPIWPPDAEAGKGMPNDRGLPERIVQIARDAIYPPVNVRVSNVIENKHLPAKGRVLLVIRVDESKDAPHAVEKRQKVYIYERVDATSAPYRLAEIERIANLLDRRRKIEEDREQMLQVELVRGTRLLTQYYPIRWAASVPYFPWRTLYPQSQCYQQHVFLFPSTSRSHAVQQMPDGSYLREMPYGSTGRMACSRSSRLSDRGLVFEMEIAEETDLHGGTGGLAPNLQPYVELKRVVRLVKRVITAAVKLAATGERPGFVMLSLGLLGARNAKLYLEGDPSRSRNEFLDDSFRANLNIDFNALTNEPYAAATSACLTTRDSGIGVSPYLATTGMRISENT